MRNPFQSIIVRAVELVYACEEALAIIDAYEEPDPPFVDVKVRAGTGYGASEAPRGMLLPSLHGRRATASFRTPTSCRPRRRTRRPSRRTCADFVPHNQELSDADMTWKCEQAVRNYDPCISCATHFLKLTVERE